MTEIIMTGATLDKSDEPELTSTADEQVEVSFLIEELYSQYPSEVKPEVLEVIIKQGVDLSKITFIHIINGYDYDESWEEEGLEQKDTLLNPNEVKSDIITLAGVFKALGKYSDYKSKIEAMLLICDKAIENNSSIMSFYY